MELRLPNRTIVRIFALVTALSAFVYLLYLVRSTVLLVFVAGFLAVALGPAVDLVQTRMKFPRGLSIVSVYIFISLVIFGVGMLVIPPVVDGVDDLSRDIPGYLEDLRENETFREYDDKYDITTKLNEQAEKLPARLGDAAGALQSVTVGVLSTIVQLVTVLTMAFFLMLDGNRIVDFLLRLRGPENEPRLRAITTNIYRATAGYVAGALSLAAMNGFLSFIVMSILGVPFAVPLAVLMSFLGLIPLVGATIGGVVILIVTAFNDFPTATIVWGIYFIAYQQLENNVLQPIIYRRAVDVSPLLVIVSILIGSSLIGVLGALVAIPVAAAVQIVVKDVWRSERDDVGPVTEGDPLDAKGPPPADVTTD